MNKEDFRKIIEQQLDKVYDMLVNKQAEYATEDLLHNFRTAAVIQNCTMEQALGGFLCKHTVSIFDMIENGKYYPLEKWDEKILDHIVYLLLLKVILVEKETNEPKNDHPHPLDEYLK